MIANNEACQLNLLKELLRDNTFFVNNFINQQVVQYLAQSFIAKAEGPEYSEKKYLEIFRLLCIVGQSVNTHNQKLILDHFIKVLQEARSPLEIRLQGEEQAITVVASLDKTTSASYGFAEFYEKCQQENPSAWEYFVEYLNLIADLVQGRNKVTEMDISGTYSLKLLGDLFEYH